MTVKSGPTVPCDVAPRRLVELTGVLHLRERPDDEAEVVYRRVDYRRAEVARSRAKP